MVRTPVSKHIQCCYKSILIEAHNNDKYLGLSPLPVRVTTRIITFLVGNPNLNLHLPLLLGGGLSPNKYPISGYTYLVFGLGGLVCVLAASCVFWNLKNNRFGKHVLRQEKS